MTSRPACAAAMPRPATSTSRFPPPPGAARCSCSSAATAALPARARPASPIDHGVDPRGPGSIRGNGVVAKLESRTVYFAGKRGQRLAYSITGSQPSPVRVDLVKVADGSVVQSWGPAGVTPGTTQTIEWKGSPTVGDSRFQFQVFTGDAASSPTAPPTATAGARQRPERRAERGRLLHVPPAHLPDPRRPQLRHGRRIATARRAPATPTPARTCSPRAERRSSPPAAGRSSKPVTKAPVATRS